MANSNRRRPPARRCAATVLLATVLVVTWAAAAGAHTEFQSSDPADGTVITRELDRITVTFTAPADPAGEGFVVLDSSGIVRSPDEVTSADGSTWVLTFTEPLPNGDVGVRWTVQAPDTHPIEGSFRFLVDGPEPEPTPAPQPTAVADGETIDDTAAAAPSDTDEAAAVLDRFLETDSGPSQAQRVTRIAAVAVIVGALVAAAVVSFLLLVLGGSLRAPLWPARSVIAGVVLLLAGSVAAVASQVALVGGGWTDIVDPSAWTNALDSAFGVAVAARLVGAILLLWWARSLALSPAHAGRQVIPAGVGAQSAGVPVRVHGASATGPQVMGAAAGGVLLVASFAFDGHTVSEGPRLIHAAANAVHVAGAAIWIGGAGMLAWLGRRPSASVTPLSVSAARFSVVATGAVVAVGLTGVTMAAFIVDGPSDLWATGWGRVLLAKVAAVALIGLLGAHNHRVVVPGLQERPDDRALLDDLRRSTLLEAGLFAIVLVLTGFLVMADAG